MAVTTVALVGLVGVAWAERPVTYSEALGAAARQHPAAVRGALAEERADAMVTAARGVFDPLLLGGVLRNVRSFQEVRDSLPISGDERGWDTTAQVTGITPTGTGYLLMLGAGYDRSFSTGLQPRYDELGEQIGTAPYEANRAFYGSLLSLTVTQQLLRGVQLSYNLQGVRLAREALSAADLAAEGARQQAMADAAIAYWTWVYQHELHRIDLDAVAVGEEAVRVAEEQVAARVLAPLERTRLEEALVLSRAAALESGVLEAQARDLLLLAMGEAPGQDVVPATAPGVPPAIEIDAASAADVAVAHNPELAAARAVASASALTLQAARHARLPALAASVTAGRTTGDQPTLGAAVRGVLGEAGQPQLAIGATVEVPLGNRVAAGMARAARTDLLTAEATVREVEGLVRAQVADHVTRLAAAQRRVELADQSLGLAQEALLAIEALAEADRAITRDVLEARNGVERARVESVRARIDWRLACTGLLRLQASLTEELP